jgi:hypothetical protein
VPAKRIQSAELLKKSRVTHAFVGRAGGPRTIAEVLLAAVGSISGTTGDSI